MTTFSEIESEAEGHHSASKHGLPMPVLLGGSLLLLYFFVARKQKKAAGTAAAKTTVGAGDGTAAALDGYSQNLQGLVAQNAALAALFGKGFTAVGTDIGALNKSFSDQLNASVANSAKIGDGLIGANGATQTLVQNLFQQFGENVNTDFTNLMNAEATYSQRQTDNTAAVGASVNDLRGFVSSQVASIGTAVQTQGEATATKLHADNLLFAQQLSSLDLKFSSLFQGVNARLDTSATAEKNLSTADYYKLGSSGASACFDAGGLSVHCLQDQGRYEVGQHDGDQTWVKNYLSTTYGDCLQGNRYDAVCVGKVIAKNQGFGG